MRGGRRAADEASQLLIRPNRRQRVLHVRIEEPVALRAVPSLVPLICDLSIRNQAIICSPIHPPEVDLRVPNTAEKQNIPLVLRLHVLPLEILAGPESGRLLLHMSFAEEMIVARLILPLLPRQQLLETEARVLLQRSAHGCSATQPDKAQNTLRRLRRLVALKLGQRLLLSLLRTPKGV